MTSDSFVKEGRDKLQDDKEKEKFSGSNE